MPKPAINSRGFAILPVLFSLVVIIVICWAGLHVWTDHYQTPPSLPQGSTDHGPIITYSNTPLPKGSASDTFRFNTGYIFPNVPASYQQLYLGYSPINGVFTPLSQPQSGGIEADYITAQSTTAVHSDAITMCNSHGFKFIESANDNTTVQCQSEVAEWQFNIEPASNFIPQPWYKLDSISETTLAKSTWLRVTTNQSVIDSPAEQGVRH